MSDDPKNLEGHGPQAHMRFDTSPGRFREAHPEDSFSGSSGVLFEQAMAQTRMAICLTDPYQDDNPIIFANRAFRALTGYEEEEIIGRNCRFLQGPDTAREPVRQLRSAIDTEEVTVVEMLNYRKDGSSFWNALHLGPIYDNDGKLVYYFGSQWDVSDVRAARSEERHARMLARELSHRMKNMFSVISGIVNVTGRVRGIEAEAAEINARIQALGRAYETTLDDASSGTIELGQAVRSILSPYDADGHRMDLVGNGGRVSFAAISLVGLILHELAANATKYGAWSADNGRVTVSWLPEDENGQVKLSWLETGGPPVDVSMIGPGTGSAITDRMLRTGGGAIERIWNRNGLHAVVTLPA
ncbi:PAS domain-containing protein [Qipengyuania soli]|nr:PAS domain-containing protein [Qipengyuania soli]